MLSRRQSTSEDKLKRLGLIIVAVFALYLFVASLTSSSSSDFDWDATQTSNFVFDSWDTVPESKKSPDVLVVGAGLSGAVLAERIANHLGKTVLIVEKRSHIAGNLYDAPYGDTDILVNKYGAHLFHTNNDRVWDYIQKFATWERWEHVVQGYVDDRFVPIPANPTTVNILTGENLASEDDMKKWLSENQVKYDHPPANSEEMAKSRVGEVLYEKLFAPYTRKQWELEPRELAPEVLARIPVYSGFDTRYFPDKYQVLPKEGYTKFVEGMLSHPLITVVTNTDYFEVEPEITRHDTIFTGPIDAYFAGAGLEKLKYRSLRFVEEVYDNPGFYQPASVVNYPSTEYPFTRIVEYKHFLNQKSDKTVIVKEYPASEGEPYYPILNDHNVELYAKYQKLAQESKDVLFVGRLANYKYFNMDATIDNALGLFDEYFGSR